MAEEEFLTREKLLGIRHHRHFKWAVLLFIIILLSDIAFLNYKILKGSGEPKSKIPKIGSDSQQNESPATTAQALQALQDDTCGADCVKEINKIVSSMLSSQKTSPSTPTTSTGTPASSSVKEFYIPFGSGVNSSDDWQDMPGLDAYIDPSSYGSIKKITFEASIHVPSGNETAEVRLLNVIKGHIVWGSEMIFTGGGMPQLLTSQALTLDPGSNLYRVQMKTQLKYPAYLDQARVHIVTY